MTATQRQTGIRWIDTRALVLLVVIAIVSVGHVFLLSGAAPYILGLPWWAWATAILYYVLTGAVYVFIDMLGGD